MNAEILSIGNELLAGRVVDTNAAFLARELESLGFRRAFRQTAGDDPADIAAATAVALARSELLLFTGGLGPTHDDLTVAALAAHLGVPLDRDERSVEAMRARFTARGVPMPASNLKQSDLPRGARVLRNPCGTAPGIFWEIAGLPNADRGRIVIALPGVPLEMRRMWIEGARPLLSPFAARTIAARSVRASGIGESAAMEKLADLLDFDGAKLFPYAGNFELEVRCLAEADDPATARDAADRAAGRVRERLGAHAYGTDDDTLEAVVGRRLAGRGFTVAVAESCTGGLVSSRLTDVPGASAWVGMNLVVYSYEAKRDLLGVRAETLERFGAVSPECVAEMAAGMRRLARADIALAVSGIAGPGGGMPGKPVGLVHLAVEDARGTLVARRTLPPDIPREAMKRGFSQFALDLLRRRLEGGEE